MESLSLLSMGDPSPERVLLCLLYRQMYPARPRMIMMKTEETEQRMMTRVELGQAPASSRGEETELANLTNTGTEALLTKSSSYFFISLSRSTKMFIFVPPGRGARVLGSDDDVSVTSCEVTQVADE